MSRLFVSRIIALALSAMLVACVGINYAAFLVHNRANWLWARIGCGSILIVPN